MKEELNLEEIRKDIDRIDREMAKLFEERMNVVMKVAEYKKINNMPVKDRAREERVLEKANHIIKNKKYVSGFQKILRDIMDFSCELQGEELKK